MNGQNMNCCSLRARLCVKGAVCFLGVLAAVALGLIFGAVYSEVILPALATVIAFVVTIAAVIIALLIYRCRRG